MIKIENLEQNLIKLFKGDLPLYKSYWIYYVLGNFLISAPLLLVTKIQIQKFIYSFSLYLVINLIYYLKMLKLLLLNLESFGHLL